MEELSADEWVAYAKEMEDALVARGYVEDAKKAAELYTAAGRKTSAFGRFFVKPDALQYDPPAGDPRPIHSIVRFIMNPGGDKGAEAKQAFEQGMAQGDVTYYSGHGRYGTGPDFDPNFGKIELLDAEGNVELEPENYKVLRQVLSDESGGNPWTRFLWRGKRGRIRIDLKNAGNLRMNAKSPHMDEFGGKLIQWALDQTAASTSRPARRARWRRTAANPDRKYRVMVFDGCNTRDYERAIRKTPGFDTRGADIIGTTRSVGFGAEVEAFTAFLDGLVGEQSPAEIIKGMNEEMKQHESDYSARPSRAGASRTTRRDERGGPAQERRSPAGDCRRPGPRGRSGRAARSGRRVRRPRRDGRRRLLDAIRDLGGAAEGRRLATSADAGERRVAARLMSLMPQPENLASLEPLLADRDPAVAEAARKALRHQWRTPAWHAAVERLARSEDPSLVKPGWRWAGTGRSKHPDHRQIQP